MQASLADGKLDVLIAEDDASVRDLITAIFEEEGWCPPTLAEDGLQALERLREKPWDILITDLNMPRLSGDDLVVAALEEHPDLTILVITGNGTIDKAVNLMKNGVFDFLTKPYSLDHFLMSVKRARDRVLNLNEVRGIRQVIDALLAAVESKDRYLNGHSFRVSDFAVGLGRAAGLERRELSVLEYAGKLHDVGKIGIHEDILNKTGKLTAEEFEIMKTHPVLSHDIVAPIKFLEPCLPAILHHHERMDGNGYPHGLVGDQIPFAARIISVVDAYDAMTTTRSYRAALPHEKVLSIISDVAGTQLDPELAHLFLDQLEVITGTQVHQPA
ncbi:MAG: HD domain-containing phosphohydrolase [Planctomycetota bacterium]